MSRIYDPQVLAGKRVLVTGGGTGLGRGVAKYLVEHGAEVHLWGRREAVLAEAAEEVGASRPGSAHYAAVDVRDADAVDAAIGQIWEEHGPLTGLINNAAANFIAQTKDISARAYRAVASTVQDGSFHTTHLVSSSVRDCTPKSPSSRASSHSSAVLISGSIAVHSLVR